MRQYYKYSKSQMLEFLSTSHPSTYCIDPFIVFSVGDWIGKRTTILKSILDLALGVRVIVRSSAAVEDADPDLPPGAFRSVLNVSGSDPNGLSDAIEDVIKSYSRIAHIHTLRHKNNVIVQRQLVNVRMSGVISILTADDLYCEVHYDDDSGQTDSVTAGRSFKRVDVVCSLCMVPQPWLSIRRAAIEIATLLQLPLYIEFGLSLSGNVHVFQARINYSKLNNQHDHHDKVRSSNILRQAIDKVNGGPTIWSDMTDWNPAEMLGARPKRLSLSLYQRLVSDASWHNGRSSLGYNTIAQPTLIDTIAGKPYVNVQKSFSSLLPASMDDRLIRRIVQNRILELSRFPHLHDKVELELLFTVADVAQPPRTDCLLDNGFTPQEVNEVNAHLAGLTQRIIDSSVALHASDNLLMNEMLHWHSNNNRDLIQCDLDEVLAYIGDALIVCKNLGVVPFARQARLAFIARDILGRLAYSGNLDQTWTYHWWLSIDSVAKRVTNAIRALASGRIPRSSFDKEFGHLRSRTYDITCPRYDQIEAMPLPPEASYRVTGTRDLTDLEIDIVGKAFTNAGLKLNTETFFDFARRAICDREELKFSFTLILSDVLEAIAVVGDKLGLSRDTMAFVSIEDILCIPSADGLGKSRLILEHASEINRAKWMSASQIRLPDIILSAVDLVVVPHRNAKPNFITEEIATADLLVLNSPSPDPSVDYSDRIIAVEAADPGFDWIFTFNIAGLVTKYGGLASHIAIRCSEFQLPAAIGCGTIYDELIKSKRIHLNCKDQLIIPVPVSVPESE